jgi:hypothetical protein
MYSKLTLLSFIRVKKETTRKNGKGVYKRESISINIYKQRYVHFLYRYGNSTSIICMIIIRVADPYSFGPDPDLDPAF